MALWMRAELGLFEKAPEVFYIAVQIAGDENFAGLVQVHDSAAPAGSISESRHGLCHCVSETDGIGHGRMGGLSLAVTTKIQAPH